MPLTSNNSNNSIVGGASYPAYGSITTTGGFNGVSGNITLSVVNTREILRVAYLSDDPIFTFTGEENGKYIELELTPERNITAYEQLLISNVIHGIALGARSSCVSFMRYVRKHNLERHFKFTVV